MWLPVDDAPLPPQMAPLFWSSDFYKQTITADDWNGLVSFTVISITVTLLINRRLSF
jgi:hypothetical protein